MIAKVIRTHLPLVDLMPVSAHPYPAAMHRGAVTRDAVLKAIVEYDELGHSVFLAKYLFNDACSYLLLHEERKYDSRAIAGAVRTWEHGRALLPEEFSGGKDHAATWLKGAASAVKSLPNPDWARDDDHLGLHLVMTNGWKGLDANDPPVIELSSLPQLIPIHAGADGNEKSRNPDGVARKTLDIATRHPDYRGTPTSGGALDIEVLHKFLVRLAEMPR
ncbi:hypothetical protein [Streptomyces sp. NPDC049881]|uniref:hypothetical protein n=1 Tax=Streptomyces sp. NPDC049881 TaxID=3155778 RepID=UPI003413F1EB